MRGARAGSAAVGINAIRGRLVKRTRKRKTVAGVVWIVPCVALSLLNLSSGGGLPDR